MANLDGDFNCFIKTFVNIINVVLLKRELL